MDIPPPRAEPAPIADLADLASLANLTDLTARRAAVAREVAAALAGPCAIPPGVPIVAACSGGADSVALVHALAAAADRWPLATVAFVDHGLRDVAEERAAAAHAADAVGAPFATVTVAVARRGNLQANARAARYAALAALAGPNARIATGHTLTDRAETVLQRIIRGTGIAGLAALPPTRGQVVRPLLSVDRATTRALGHRFADDPSNLTARFQRNRVRAEIFPLLARENPRIAEALCALADAAADSQALVAALAMAEDAAAPDGPNGFESALRAHVHGLASALGAGRAPRRGAVQQLARALATGAPSASFALGNGFRALARAGQLTFMPDDDPRKSVVAWGPGHYRLAAGVDLEVEHVVGSRSADQGPMAIAASSGGPATLLVREAVSALSDSCRMAFVSEYRWPIAARRLDPNGSRWVVTDGDGRILLEADADFAPTTTATPLPSASPQAQAPPPQGNAWILVRLVFRQSGSNEEC